MNLTVQDLRGEYMLSQKNGVRIKTGKSILKPVNTRKILAWERAGKRLYEIGWNGESLPGIEVARKPAFPFVSARTGIEKWESIRRNDTCPAAPGWKALLKEFKTYASSGVLLDFDRKATPWRLPNASRLSSGHEAALPQVTSFAQVLWGFSLFPLRDYTASKDRLWKSTRRSQMLRTRAYTSSDTGEPMVFNQRLQLAVSSANPKLSARDEDNFRLARHQATGQSQNSFHQLFLPLFRHLESIFPLQQDYASDVTKRLIRAEMGGLDEV